MKELLERMNAVLYDWKKNFDIGAKMEMEFRLNEDRKLCLNDYEIQFPDKLALSSVDFDAESVKFYFEDTTKVLAIGIGWPEDEAPFVDTVNFGDESET